jgi:hypothetical protein
VTTLLVVALLVGLALVALAAVRITKIAFNPPRWSARVGSYRVIYSIEDSLRSRK